MAHVAGMVYITLLNNIVVTKIALLLPLLSAQKATSEANTELLLWLHYSGRPAHHQDISLLQ